MNKVRNENQDHRSTLQERGGWCGAPCAQWVSVGVVGVIATVCVLVPMAGVVAKIARLLTEPTKAGKPGPSETVDTGTAWLSLGWSAMYAGLIGAIAVLLALPAAWTMRSARLRGLVGVLSWVPMLMPAYLAYAALTTLRSPNSWLGDVLARCDPAWSMLAGRAMALGGLALWAWPIAMLVLAPSIGRIDSSVLEMLRLDTGWFGRARVIWAMTWRAMIVAWLIVAVVMLGSAVPLHLAQVPTAATRVWLLMSLTTDPVRIWSAAVPLLLVAVVAAVMMTRLVMRFAQRAESGIVEGGGGRGERSRAGARRLHAAALVIALGSILTPMVLMAMSVKRWSSITGFWDESGPAVVSSVLVALASGTIVGLLCVAAWFACSNGASPRRATMIFAGVLAAAALTPGVLVGQAIAGAYGDDRFGMLAVVIAHIARFGCIGALAGVLLAGLEPRDRRAMRLIDGAVNFRGWVRTILLDTTSGRGWTMLIGVGLIGACLSLHEIEATVMVLPPGGRALAQQLLEQLHYLRDEHLGAAVVNVMSGALLAAFIAAWLCLRGTGIRGAPVHDR